jgi:hypothetical protein
MIMQEQINQIETLFEKTKHYTQTSVELYKLKAIDKTADIASTLASRLVIGAFITMFFLILNIGISLWLGELLGKSYYGFFITSGFYAVGAIIFYILRNKWIKASVRDSIIAHTLN